MYGFGTGYVHTSGMNPNTKRCMHILQNKITGELTIKDIDGWFVYNRFVHKTHRYELSSINTACRAQEVDSVYNVHRLSH